MWCCTHHVALLMKMKRKRLGNDLEANCAHSKVFCATTRRAATHPPRNIKLRRAVAQALLLLLYAVWSVGGSFFNVDSYTPLSFIRLLLTMSADRTPNHGQ